MKKTPCAAFLFWFCALSFGLPPLAKGAENAFRIFLAQPIYESAPVIRGQIMPWPLPDKQSVTSLAIDIDGYPHALLPAAVDNTGRFEFPTVSAGPLREGSTVTATCAISGQQCQPFGPVAVASLLYDWGRVRAYFSAGIMTSKERDQFSKNDVFLGFNLDKNWKQWRQWRSDGTPARSKRPVHFNTFFEAILAAIPVAPGAGTDTEVRPAAAAEPLADVLRSPKAAVLRVGGYVPVVLEKWKFSRQDNALFVGPLAKAGLETITGGQRTGEVERFGGDDMFNFFALGARVGHYRMNGTRDTSPELISYLDAGVGRFESFEVVRCKDSSGKENNCLGADPGTIFARQRPWRWAFEGRLKVPGLPLYLGFNANAGKGRDDLRFVFGTQFDIGAVYRKLRPSIP